MAERPGDTKVRLRAAAEMILKLARALWGALLQPGEVRRRSLCRLEAERRRDRRMDDLARAQIEAPPQRRVALQRLL